MSTVLSQSAVVSAQVARGAQGLQVVGAEHATEAR